MLGVSFSSNSSSFVNFYLINLEFGEKSTELLDRGLPDQVVILIAMANLDWSWVSLGVDENDLMCVDPVAAAAALIRAIKQLTDGEVAAAAHRCGLNIRSDAMILRNRVERHEMRRHFGADIAPWNPALDEPSKESGSMQSLSSSSRHSAANFSSNRVPEQAAVFSSDADLVPLSTGQSMI